jgi:catechol 2,3-dioxygenase-like lactoylglutathione lyase family enzyme
MTRIVVLLELICRKTREKAVRPIVVSAGALSTTSREFDRRLEAPPLDHAPARITADARKRRTSAAAGVPNGCKNGAERAPAIPVSCAEPNEEDRMETQELHRGRLIDHIQLVVRDLPASQRFYTAILKSLNIPIGGAGDGYFWADELFVSTPDSQAAQGVLTGRHHLAFQAENRRMVDAFYKSALANGGKDNGAPGERPYHPGYYAAFVLDPDGNNVEAVYHGEAQRSAPSVLIKF